MQRINFVRSCAPRSARGVLMMALTTAALGLAVGPMAGIQHVHAQPAATPASETEPIGGPYSLDFCPVTGEPLGSMGEPYIHRYEGREIRFCCRGCLPRFEREAATILEKIDAELAKRQRLWYPLETCLVTGEALDSMGEPFEHMHGNRLVMLCCRGCVRHFNRTPERLLATLDKAVVEKQKASYPLETCLVSGEPLGSMGEPVDAVLGGRLVRLCCPGCKAALHKEPARYLKALDEAAKTQEEER